MTLTADRGTSDAHRRVAHVAATFGEIAQTFIADALVELERVGWEPWLVTGAVKDASLYDFPPRDRIVIVPHRWRPRRIAERLLLGASQAPPPIRPHRGLKRVEPALVHAQFAWAAIDTVPVARALGLPVTATFRGSDVTVLPGIRRWRKPYRRMFSELEQGIVVCRFLRDRLRAIGFRGRLEVIPSGLRIDEFPFRGARTPQQDDAVRLLYVGRHVPYKGFDVLLRALDGVVRRHPSTRLDVIGSGALLRHHQRLAARLGHGGRVTFHGARPRAEVLRALQATHVQIVPSRTMPNGHAEGLANVAKEALAVGVQLVATGNGGLPEAVPPEFREDLADEGDHQALADAINDRLSRVDEWPDRSRMGRDWVEREFDARMLALRTAELYSKLIAA